MRSIFACSELAPNPAKDKNNDLSEDKSFGRGDAIRLTAIGGEVSATDSLSCSPDRVQRICGAYLRVPNSRPTLPKIKITTYPKISRLAGETRFEHATNGFGDHYSTVEPLP